MSLRVGIFAPSFPVPPVEFLLGLQDLVARGVEVQVHPQTLRQHRFFAGTDRERAEAFLDLAHDPEVGIIWCARGGYGAARMLPLLNELSGRRGKPAQGKLLAGYSDVTALHDFVRSRWGWHSLHAPMPGLRKFCELRAVELDSTLAFMKGALPRGKRALWGRLRFFGPQNGPKTPRAAIEGELTGGNLSVWASLIGTPHQPGSRGKIVFFEDVDEPLYRLDRMLNQAVDSGSLDGARALVLGNFLNCRDPAGTGLMRMPSPRRRAGAIRNPGPEELGLVRPPMEPAKAIREIFAEAARRLGIPLAFGLPVGHGPEKMPLPLGARYRLSPSGAFELRHWAWLDRS